MTNKGMTLAPLGGRTWCCEGHQGHGGHDVAALHHRPGHAAQGVDVEGVVVLAAAAVRHVLHAVVKQGTVPHVPEVAVRQRAVEIVRVH